MIGRTFPLVVRAMRVDSRDVKPHLFRAALGAVVLCTLISMHVRSSRLSAPGLDLFWWVTQYNYWFVTIAAATFFATAITEEKEERTLPLLKMAGVGAGSLMLGKWLPRLIGAGLLLAIQYPFTILAVTLGGVLWEQVSCAYLSLLAHLFLVGNLGLLASVVCRRSNSAVGLTVLVLFLYHVLPWAIFDLLAAPPTATLRGWLAPLGEVAHYALMAIGRWQLLNIVATGFKPDFSFGIQVASNCIAGAALFLTGLALFAPCTRNDAEPTESIWTRRLRFASGSGTRRPWPLALIWKDFYYLTGGPVSIFARLILYGGVIALMVGILSDWNLALVRHDDVGGAAMLCSVFILWIEGAVMGTRVYRTEINDRTWATLCMLPRPLYEVANNKLAGTVLGLLPGIATFWTGAVIAPDVLGDFLDDVTRGGDAPFAVYILLLQPILALHLAVWISVTISWANWAGAIFIGGFLVFIFNFMLMSCLITLAPSGPDQVAPLFVLLDVGTLGLFPVIYVLVGNRLAEAAAE